jgi:hypothetical protein
MADHLAAFLTKLTVSNTLDIDDIRAIQNLPTRSCEFGAREVVVAEVTGRTNAVLSVKDLRSVPRRPRTGRAKYFHCTFPANSRTCRVCTSS